MIDLHTHSTFSDGLCTPAQLVKGAAANGLKALAITDHDSMGGWLELKREAVKHHIEPIPAFELDADYRPAALHIIGYYVDPMSGVLIQHLDWLRQGRASRNEAVFAKLHRMGMPLRWHELEKISKNEVLGRLHIAKAMVARGYAASVKDAFSKYLGKGRPAYVPRNTLSPDACIQLIHEADGVAVLAHPSTLSASLTPTIMRRLMAYLVDAGLDGIEVYYPGHGSEETQAYIRMAHSLNLLITGGSDFHDGPEALKRLGYVARQALPDSLLENLKNRKAQRLPQGG